MFIRLVMTGYCCRGRNGREVDHYTHLFELSTEIMIVMNDDGMVQSTNGAFAKTLGYSVEAELRASDTLYTLIHEEDRDASQHIMGGIWSGLKPEEHGYESRFRHADGTYRWIRWKAAISPDRSYLYFVGRDVSGQKKDQEALAGKDAWYHACLDQLIVCFGYYSAIRNEQGEIVDFRIEYVNEESCRTNHYTKEQAIGRRLSELFPGALDALFPMFRHVTETGETVLKESMYYEDISMMGTYDIVYFKMGDGFANCWRNVTDRQKIKQSIMELKQTFASVFHSNASMNFIIDVEQSRIVDANSRFLETVHEDSQAAIGERIVKEALVTGLLQSCEWNFTKQSGEIGHGLFSGEVVTMQDRRYMTELRKAEQHLAMMDKLNMLGSMAAGIAHEVRNPMTTVKGFLQLMNRNPQLHSYRSTLELMVSELDRANLIISEYLSLANTHTASKKPKLLSEIVEQMLPLLQADATVSGIAISSNLRPNKPLLVDEKEIKQLVLNLSRNAIEAMKQGGVLTIATYEQDQTVILEVADQGSGIPDSVRDSVFSPFVTTKETGTGLGLSVCRSIAEHHNANIDFESNGLGTTFRIRFPWYPAPIPLKSC
jgi:two-component system, sporulation sensor kinase E